MTATQETRRVRAPRKPDAPTGSRFARWLAGWRVSLRMARRDIARHKGRSALVAVMVGLPVVIMIGGLTAIATQNISPREAIPARMGSAQAVLAGQTPTFRVVADPARSDALLQCDDVYATTTLDGTWGVDQGQIPCGPATHHNTAAKAVPGLSPKATLPQAREALTRLTGGRLVPVAWVAADIHQGKRPQAAQILQIDAADPAARGMVELTSGRWPSKPGEYVVTDVGIQRGVPSTGTVLVRAHTDSDRNPQESPTPAAIVGTATAALSTTPVELVGMPPTTLAGTQFLLMRDTPVTWSDVTDLNAYGIALLSRDVLDHPGQVPPRPGVLGTVSQTANLTALALLCLALLVESCLLAGPAFAVIAQRQRRSLALAAANGAPRAQLRRTLLAQALVLGVAAAVVGLVVGVVGAAVLLPWVVRAFQDQFIGVIGPLEVPGLESAIVVGCAVVASIVSALIPARGLTRLDVVAALRGDVVSPAPHRGVPVLGAALCVLGSATLVASVIFGPSLFGDQSSLAATVAAVASLALVVGALCLVPVILAGLGRLTTRLPVWLRLATRDASRQRGRAIPTVAAIMAGAILVTGFGIAGLSVDERFTLDYRPMAPPGAAIVYAGTGDVSEDGLAHAVRDTIHGGVVHTEQRLDPGRGTDVPPAPGEIAGTAHDAPVYVLTRPGCDAARIVAQPPDGGQGQCSGLITSAVTGDGSVVTVMSADELVTLYGLGAEAARVLRSGGVVVTEPTLVRDGRVEVVTGKVDEVLDGRRAVWAGETARRSLPAVAVSALPFSPAGGMTTTGGPAQALLTPQVAATLGVPVAPQRYVVTAPEPITDDQRLALVDALGVPYVDMVTVERGYQSPLRLALLIMVVAVTLLILVATLTATALSMGEARRDLATLAAVGAPDGIRRRLAGAQAGLLALVGTALGLAVGAVPGLVVAWSSTTSLDMQGRVVRQGPLVVPWLAIAVALVVVPLLAAGLAALFVRVRPDLTRRLS